MGRSERGNIPPRPGHSPSTAARGGGAPAETASETTARLRPAPVQSPPAPSAPPHPTTPPSTRDPRSDAAKGPATAPDARAEPALGADAATGPVGPARRPSALGPTGRPGSPGSPGEAQNRPRPTDRPQRPTESAWTAVPPRPSFDASRLVGAAGTSQKQPSGASPAAPVASAGTPPRATSAAAAPDPALSWSAATAPGTGLGMGFGEPEGYDRRARGALVRPRVAVAAVSMVLGLGLIGGAVTGSWLTGEPGKPGAAGGFATAGAMWHSVPVDQLFPPTVDGRGAGPGGADRTWTRVAVAPDSDCAGAFDPLLRKVLAPVGCARLLRATYTDATQSYVTTVGLLFTKADASAMTSLAALFENEGLARRTDLVPRPYAAKGTVAAAFGDEQRASWTVSVLTEAPVVVYAVSGWADGRAAGTPQAAADATKSGATTPAAQTGLGNEAQGLADRIERGLRQTVKSATEKPS
ncbi:hypothetical protein [Streptomyces sp. NPDC001292]|uniref:hypothetical protein n=1 Tax=Streptomyces sp. NPDC001292 TaxID=3364558 RepID=UPI0036AD12CE